MRLVRRTLLLLTVAALTLGLLPAGATAAPALEEERVCPPSMSEETGSFNKGALWKICVPREGWNGNLIVFAHGYQPPSRDLNFAVGEWGELLFLPLAAEQGYAYAATTYRRNGLVVWDALKDNRALLKEFRERHGRPERTLLVGQSLGGLIVTQLIERYPELADGALSLSGPVGSFRGQIEHWGDFRVLFDYFFPGLLPGDVTYIPPGLLDNVDGYLGGVFVEISKPERYPDLARLVQMTGAVRDADLGNPAIVIDAALSLLWFGIVSTSEAQAVLGGNMFDNMATDYGDDAVNAGVGRFSADADALAALKRLETSGRPRKPLVVGHTLADPIVPAWHVERYSAKLDPALADNVTFLPLAPRYGHVTFTAEEVLSAFSALLEATE